MSDLTKLGQAALAAAVLTACAQAPSSETQPAPAHAAASPADVNAIGDRFAGYFRDRCALPIKAGDAPDTAGLIPATAEVIARFPKVPDYEELSGRDLSFWMAPDDSQGAVILVIEEGPEGERCAAVTEAFSTEQFAGLLKKTYPEYLGEASDDSVVNARAFLDDAGDSTRSVIYSSYHDAKTRVSAGVVSLSEAD
ncbi:hypothetical protein G5B40_20075 [Pikeienuella piscinae]|uniref:Lipoprotein n=1 Tax=Pikeienuella piscinae TaxID=2748098 RepID=A0A7M3T6B1_9RHOB|nr:hypothetical protein [Pikeienuella piscinae]QIE57542.1 hypothetical protein G5B40_20075 [Pikeienuella piscinae]